MAVGGSAVHKNHNPTLHITELSPIIHFCHNGCLSRPYLGKESTKWIVIQFDTYVDVNEGSTENNNHSPSLHFT